jgi:hypothetical protein
MSIQITGINGKPDATRQIVFFSAREEGGFSLDQFHWIPTARALGVRAYFLRDTSNSFYLKNNRPALRLIKGIMKGFGGETWFVGSSMGGYCAINFGHKLKPAKIIAFAPTPPEGDKTHLLKGFPPIDIHVSRKSRYKEMNGKTDPVNARLFKDVANIIYHESSVHNVAGFLRDNGELKSILL